MVKKRFLKDFSAEEFLQLWSMGDISLSRKKLTDVGKDTSSIRVLLGADTLGIILTGWNEVARNHALYDKYDIAESRLPNLTERLIRENNFEDYDDVFQQWELEGIESVPSLCITSLIGLFSITHHYYEDFPSVRSIFQATWICFFQRVLSIGPSLIHRLPPLQIRLRLGTIGVIADIKQTFLQICVGAEDRNVLKFL
ncbi:DUF1758 domain-containing protein [Trichonephila clavipes]|nr:DUF1758 domain-containing protein [Trichonephila clavipes]